MIGIFDSGIGGVTVLKEIIKLLPNYHYFYYSDSKNNPYGDKNLDQIYSIVYDVVVSLMEQGCTIIVIACNTATACALETVEHDLDIPIIGVIHAGARTAIESTKNGKIGIIGTEGTIRSGVYTRVIKEMREDIEVTGKPCPLL